MLLIVKSFNSLKIFRNHLLAGLKQIQIRTLGEIDKDPPLLAFDAQIARYEALEDKILDIQQIKVIGWVKIDAKPIKSDLSLWVSKWT